MGLHDNKSIFKKHECLIEQLKLIHFQNRILCRLTHKG